MWGCGLWQLAPLSCGCRARPPSPGALPPLEAFPEHAVTFINITCRGPDAPPQIKQNPSEHLHRPQGEPFGTAPPASPRRDPLQPTLRGLSNSLLQMSMALFFPLNHLSNNHRAGICRARARGWPTAAEGLLEQHPSASLTAREVRLPLPRGPRRAPSAGAARRPLEQPQRSSWQPGADDRRQSGALGAVSGPGPPRPLLRLLWEPRSDQESGRPGAHFGKEQSSEVPLRLLRLSPGEGRGAENGCPTGTTGAGREGPGRRGASGHRTVLFANCGSRTTCQDSAHGRARLALPDGTASSFPTTSAFKANCPDVCPAGAWSRRCVWRTAKCSAGSPFVQRAGEGCSARLGRGKCEG